MKKIIIAIVAIAVSGAAIVGFSSFAGQNDTETIIATTVHSHAQGKNCTATVGCDCSGFSPITDGKEYQKNYCKRCGHHKKYHR